MSSRTPSLDDWGQVRGISQNGTVERLMTIQLVGFLTLLRVKNTQTNQSYSAPSVGAIDENQ